MGDIPNSQGNLPCGYGGRVRCLHHPRVGNVWWEHTANSRQEKARWAGYPAGTLPGAPITRSQASVRGGYGSASHSKLMSTPQGTTGDDPADQDSNNGPRTDPPANLELFGEFEGGNFLIKVPFRDASCSVCLNTTRGNFMALNINDAIRHAKDYHRSHTPTFKCRDCHKGYESKHAALCHVPKCTGPKVPPPNAVRCEHCQWYFRCRMGLHASQHERTAHPQIRNEARARTSGVDRQQAPSQGGFTVEEVNLMLELERRFYGDSRVSKKMEGFLNRTAKQLRDKRALSSYKALRDAYLRDYPPQNAPSSHPRTESEGNTTDQEGIVERSEPATPQGILEHALAHEIPQNATPGKSAEAVQLLRDALQLASEPDYEFSQAQVDLLYQKATSHFRPTEGEAGGKIRPRVRGKGRSKKRFLYAWTQELYKKNPGEVAKLVRQGVDWVEGYQQPSLVDVKELHSKLWGKTPPCAGLPAGRSEAQIPASQALSPFTVSEIRKRISSMKQSTAPGIDGIRRAAALRKGNIEVLHLLYNQLLLTGKLPTEWSMNRTTLLPKEGKDLTKAENYRPITIASLLSRAFW
ncbi:uncharacterized protein LOC123317843 [Coccinella septempunctata]|uniref:uncharacterized protein LOC123317843 n=1 Tax=Coccinella septempunctata TaxID=41139 RepID=UPI001D095B0B|nr:uncharacterized protein LOC123317843 [Coccinella septempunctata]